MGMTVSSKKRGRRAMAEINVVPYIDVMLVLLIIFMVTAPLMKSRVDIELPKSNAKSLEQKTAPILISLDKQNVLYLTLGKGEPEWMKPPWLPKFQRLFGKMPMCRC